MPLQEQLGIPPTPSWTPKGESQTIEAEIGEVTIRGIVKKYRHNGATFWEYSIQESGKEYAFNTNFESDEEARKEALEKFKDVIQVVSENLNTELK
jgi:hypothetical protein